MADLDTDNALVTLGSVKSFVGSADSEDELMQSIINQASWRANKETDRELLARAQTEYYNGDGSNLLITRNSPINSITAIYMDSDREFGSDTLVDSDNYQIDPDTEAAIWFTGTVLITGIKVIKLQYNAGYSTVPWDLREAVIELILYWYKEIMDKRIGVESRGIEGRSQSFSHKVPEDILDTFWNYKRMVVL